MNKQLKILFLTSTIAITSTASAEIPKIAAGLNIGTPGFGAEARTQISDNLYGRLGFNYFKYADTKNSGSIHYDANARLLTVPIMLDFHPIDNSGFRLSAGAAYNGNEINLSAKPAKSVTLNGRTYTASEVGQIKSKLTLGNKIAPIISLGYDNSLIDDSPFSFNAEAGIMYAGNPKLSVSSNGNIDDARKAQKLKDIEVNANRGLKSAKKYLKFFPILSVGVKYNF